MARAAFVGFGEINTPKDILERKCRNAHDELRAEGIDTVTIYPVTDDCKESDVKNAIAMLENEKFDCLVVCVAGWIPTHAVVKVCEHFKHKPMVLWGLCGWLEDGRLITTADQAGTSAIRKVFSDLGYTFKFFYDIIGKPSNAKKISLYIKAAETAELLRSTKAGMAGYRDMNLYGTQADGVTLKKTVGTEIECFEMLEIVQRYNKISYDRKEKIINDCIKKWKFLKEPKPDSLEKTAGYYLAISEICRERGYKAISLKDVDGMKKLLGFPPAPVFMLLADEDRLCTIPENDCLGLVTQLMVSFATGQAAAYLEFYEFFENGVLAGVPDYVPSEVTDGDTLVMPAAFGELSEGILNVSKVKQGLVTMCRITMNNGKYYMHMVKGEGKTPMKWEEAGWTQPAPQLPGLFITLDDTEGFAENVMCQHYIISYGDNTDVLGYLCDILGIEII